MAAMVNEACLLLGEGVADAPADVDLVMVNGYGFPATRGGPLFWAAGQPFAEIEAAVDAAVAAGAPHGRKASNLAEVLATVRG
jgi:3-hydroxyacyl-CoA dehydrogenase